MKSAACTAAFNEGKALGGDGIATPTLRTADQTLAGVYWAYDGTPSLCAPPCLYHQIAEVIATQMGSDTVDQARLFALLNVSMAACSSRRCATSTAATTSPSRSSPMS